ncbi:UNVERIFIED_CONTAM: hypothetical protein Sangu_1032000 [Sesamum angustifolium]|uniref:Endonuclease/exonuclease/phosphatase domain-containing protein n=1 Tax=Sesamum angustifolium TaxID=2727405 RepID=A0AAW2NYQ7_9LAMI
MDSLTMKMERVSYARILVEVDASKKLVDHVEFILPNGVTRKQPVVYEYTPKFCSTCKRFGHLKESCQPPAAIHHCRCPDRAEPKKAQPTEWTVVRRRQRTNLKQQPAKAEQMPDDITGRSTEQTYSCAQPAAAAVPRPSLPAVVETESDTDSSGSSNDRTPRHRHSTSCRGLRHPFQHRRAKHKQQQGGDPLPHLNEDRILEREGIQPSPQQNGVAHLIKNNQLCLLGILETKLAATAIPKIINRLFPGWCQANNFDAIAGGRILIIWNPQLLIFTRRIYRQVIHCRVTNKSSQLSFYISFTYGLYTVVNRRSMWEKLLELGQPLNMPWIILGDFNCVKSPAEKQLGVPPTWYELKDFADCCLALGLHDAQTTGCYYTWYSNSDSNPVWCKLDRVLLNNDWLEAGFHCTAHFNPPGCLSDHSPGIVSIFDNPAPKPKPFRFFNMWADHPDFIPTIERQWD